MTEHPSSDPAQDELDPVTLQAIDWLIRLDSGQSTPQDHDAFQQWLSQDPQHQQSWLTIRQQIDEPFHQLEQQSLDAQLPVQAVTRTLLRSKKRKLKPYLIGGGTGLLVILLVSGWLLQTRPMSFWQADYYTRTAEQKDIRLADGSHIKLNAYSSIRVDYSQNSRDIYLLEGTLVADVRADQMRPFTVHTRQGHMQALGTEFMVQQQQGYSQLAVLKHSVLARNSHQKKRVAEGKAVRMDQDHITDIATEARILASWQDGVLEVYNMPLSDVINAIRPYHKGYIYLSRDVQNLKVYGVFYLNHTDRILETLAATQPLQISKLGQQVVYIDLKHQKK